MKLLTNLNIKAQRIYMTILDTLSKSKLHVFIRTLNLNINFNFHNGKLFKMLSLENDFDEASKLLFI